jgi:Copper transport outer membrane protein, MctB
MERLRVLVGEPLLVIDFRYHLVSLIAVFLAVALGIVIGTTALNEPIQADIEGQVTDLERDKRDLEDRTQQLQAQVNTADSFAEAVAPVLVDGTLAGSSVLLVVTDEEVAPETIEDVGTLIGEAGGTLSGTLRLLPEYSDPSTSTSLQNYVTGAGTPAGIQLPETDDTGQLVASLLAQVLMIPADGAQPPAAALSTVLGGLEALNVVAQETAVAPADYALVLTTVAFDGEDAEERSTTVAELVAALDAAGSGAVVVGDSGATGETGLVGVVRADPALSSTVSTVDNVATSAGQVSAVLALAGEGEGVSGQYGTGEDAQPVPPVPAVAP